MRDEVLTRSVLGCFAGNISKEGKNVVQYRVASLRDLINIVIPHFDKYPLITKKKRRIFFYSNKLLN